MALTDVEIGERLQSMKSIVLKTEPEAENSKDADLRRFLQAKDFDVPKAAKLYVQHLNWRRSFLPLGYIQETDITKELQRKQIFVQGHDRHGYSILIALTARHRAFERNLEEVKRLFVYAFEKALQLSNVQGEDKFVIIVDLKDWGLRNMDVRAYLAMIDIIQNQFPERLQKMFAVHVPSLFWRAWKVVYPFIDKATRDKIFFLQDENLQETMLQDIDKDQLPDIYGGDMELVPVQNSGTAN